MNTNRMGLRFATTLIMAGALVGPVTADNLEAGVRELSVTYDDLDIAKPAGAARLYQRIQTAAATVCAPLNEQAMHDRLRAKSCVERAVTRAVADVGAPALSRYHARRTGSPVAGVVATGRP